VYETLVRYEPPASGDGPGRFEPGLAKSWKLGPGKRSIRIDLRDDLRFHNGRKLTSVDVQFSIDMARRSRVKAEHLRRQLADVTSVELVGPRAVRIRLSRPNGYVLRALTEIPIVPRSVYRGKLQPRKGPVVGSGPYKLDSWSDGRIRLMRNADYWGEAPAIETIDFVHEPDAAKALTAAKRGELDVIPALIREHYPEQVDAPAIQADFAPLRLRPAVLRYLAVAHRSPPLADVRVREAVAKLVDRVDLIESVYGGIALAVGGPIWERGPGDGRGVGAPVYDPTRAGALLDAAGWTDEDKTGRRSRDGQRLHVALLALPSGDVEEREHVIKHVRKAGFFVEVRRGNAAVLMNRLKTGDFDLALLEWNASVDTDLSPLVGAGGKLNFGRFKDDAVEAILDRLRAAQTPAARAKILPELADRLAETWPIIPIAAPDPVGLVHRRVRGVRVWDGWIRLRHLSLAHETD
jgi:peptide/nickel transport system substrate-binding protein